MRLLKRAIPLFVLLLVVGLFLLPDKAEAEAFSGSCGDSLSWELADGVLTISGSGAMTEHSELSTVPWYSHCDQITAVVIRNGVTSIGSRAFESCINLTDITIPDGVKTIGDYAFSGCSHLTSITLPSSVTSIGDRTFDQCHRLADITIPDGVKTIGSQVFSGCYALNGSITIPKSVEFMSEDAFWGCPNYKAIIIDADNPNYSSLDGVLFNKDKTVLYTFPTLCSITQYTIPDGVITISSHAFYDCSRLTRVTIPDSVTTIGDYAFSSSRLFNVTFGSNVTSIGSNAFSDCDSLSSVTIPDSVTAIGDHAFSFCTNLTTLTLGNSVRSIGYGAFSKCTLLSGVTIPDSVKTIGDFAFNECVWMTDLVLSKNLTSIGESAFNKCRSITNVTLGNSVTSIGQRAFYGCSGLTTFTIPASVTSIGNAAFSSCTNMQSFSVDGNNPSYCSVDGVLFNKDKTQLLCFPADSDITEYNTADSVVEIMEDAFKNCSKLTAVTVSDSVNIIGAGAFDQCTGLTKVTIGSGVKFIRTYAFRQCTSLTEIRFRGKAPAIAKADAFRNVVATAYYPLGDTSWNSYSKQNYGGTLTWVLYELSPCEKGHTYDHSCDPDCNVCGEKRTVSHNWNQGAITKPATCAAEGIFTYTCTVCGQTKTEAIPKLTTHIYDNSCDPECNVCGQSRTISHSWNSGRVTKNATCAEEGVTTFICTVCGQSKTESIAKTAHDYDSEWRTDASGHWHSCIICGHKDAYAAHTPGSEATESTSQTCTVCGYVIQPPLGHTHQYSDQWSISAGTHYHLCSCGQKADEASHIYDNNCDSDCSVCGYTRNASHAWDQGQIVKKATCVAEGQLLYTCTVCAHQETESLPMLSEHSWDEGTPNDDGTVTFICVICGATRTEGSPITPSEPETQPGESNTQPTEPATQPSTPESQPTAPTVTPPVDSPNSFPWIWILVIIGLGILIAMIVWIRKKQREAT